MAILGTELGLNSMNDVQSLNLCGYRGVYDY